MIICIGLGINILIEITSLITFVIASTDDRPHYSVKTTLDNNITARERNGLE